MLLEGWLAVMLAVEAAAFASSRRFLARSSQAAAPRERWSPLVSVLVPCKGEEPGLAKNLAAISAQSHARAELLLIVDSLRDPAVPAIKRLVARDKRARLLVSGRADGYRGKVAALRTGVRKARGEVLAFADADIRPGAGWLSELVSPLAGGQLATTGYRWYVPERGAFAECLRAAWDAVGLGVEFTPRYSFFWGGSGALRRSTFRALGIERRWKGQFSDDSAVTLALREQGKAPFFLPTAVSPSIARNGWRELLEWTNRQIWITRLYNKRAWKHALLTYGFFSLIALSGVAVLAAAGTAREAAAGVALLALPALGRMLRHRWLQKGYQALLPAHARTMQRFQWRVALCAPLVPLLLFYNLARAPLLEGVVWRGNRYRA